MPEPLFSRQFQFLVSTALTGLMNKQNYLRASRFQAALGSWASVVELPPPMFIRVVRWAISFGTDAVKTCKQPSPRVSSSSILSRWQHLSRRYRMKWLGWYLVTRLSDEDLVLDPYSDAPVPVRGLLVEYRDRGNVDPRFNGDYLWTCRWRISCQIVFM